MNIRPAHPSETDSLAAIWRDGWQDAHAGILPVELARLRTLQSFKERLTAAISSVRTAGPVGAPIGFTIVKDDELYQLYVSAAARGSGLAAALVANAEARIAEAFPIAWLACAIGNDRAARFYEKCGWRCVSTVTIDLETSNGPFPVELWRYEKPLGVRRTATFDTAWLPPARSSQDQG